jgi:hypothetical protein
MLDVVEAQRGYPAETVAVMTAAFDGVSWSVSTRIKRQRRCAGDVGVGDQEA